MKRLLAFVCFVIFTVGLHAQGFQPVLKKQIFRDSININKGWEIKGHGVTALAPDLNKLYGLSTTKVELGYVAGVTSAIQTQLNAKQATLVSGVNISTVAGISLLTGEDIPIAGTGTVTSFAVTSANGVSATVANSTTAANATFTLGAITPTSVNGITLSGGSTPSLTVTGTSTISSTNTGDNATNSQYSGLVTNSTHTGDVTGSGALTIASGAVTLAKMAGMATASVIYRKTAGTGVPEVQTLATLKTDLGLIGNNSGDQTSVTGNAGTATTLQSARTINGVSFNGSANIIVPSNITPGALGNRMESLGDGAWHSVTPPDTIEVGGVNEQTGTTYTLALSDNENWVRCTNGSAITLTIAPYNTIALPVNAEITIVQGGAGTVTVTAGSGVTLESIAGAHALSGQNAGATLKQRATNIWVLIGAIE
jgi:hypothetical protein